jgi:hypothetical protein
MRITIRLILALAVHGLWLAPTYAQGEGQPLLPVSQRQVKWQRVSTKNIEVYYQQGNLGGAERVARYAELARYELGLTLDYRPKGPHVLVYLPQEEGALFAPFAYQQREDFPGIFELPPGFRVVIQPASTADLYLEVKRQMAHNLLQEFSYGDGLAAMMQKQVLLYDARWFSEGLADFMGQGWTYQDEQLVATLTSYELLTLAQDGDGPLSQVARKSIWHYITSEYGEQKISEIIYLVNISHSIESGIISVLGVTLNTLTDRWQQYMAARFNTQQQGRINLSELDQAIRLPHHKGEVPTSFAFHRGSGQVAIYFQRLGEQTLWLYDLEQRRYQATPIKTGLRRGDVPWYDAPLPLAWSHDGKHLATTVYRHGRYRLAFWDRTTNEVSYVNLPDEVEAIRGINWAYQDHRLAYSVQHEGQTDIWIARPGSQEFVTLTDDAFDDLDPVWSLDDQFVFFSSNRDSSGVRNQAAHWDSYQRHFDLFRLSLPEEGPRVLSRVTQTPEVDERMPYPVSSYELMYESNASGIANLEKVNVFTHDVSTVTNFAIGFSRFQADEERLLLQQTIDGQAELFWVPISRVTSRRKPEPTLLRLAYSEAYRSRQKVLQANSKLDSLADMALEAPTQAPQPSSPSPAETDSDSTKAPKPVTTEESTPPVRYYIFDEESTPYEVRKPEPQTDQPRRRAPEQQRGTSKVITTVFGQQPAPQLESMKVNRNGKPSIPWQTDYLGVNLVYDPFVSPDRQLPRYGAAFALGFSDIFNQHQLQIRLTPYFNFRNFQASVRYDYRKGLIDWFGEAAISGRRWQSFPQQTNQVFSETTYHFNQYNLQAGGRYPLSSFAFAEASVGGFYINRLDQNLDRPEPADISDQLLRAGAAIQYRNITSDDGFRRRGTQARVSFDSYYSLPQQAFAFHRLQFEGRYYQPVAEQMVLAFRLSGALNLTREVEQYFLGGVDQRLIGPLVFQGSEQGASIDPMMDTTLYQAHFLSFATPVRGFLNGARSGSRYLLSNIELRIPVTRMLKQSLSSRPLYNLEIIPFFDIGAVWVEGNPFSQKKPTDTRIIPMGTQGPFSIRLQTLKSPFLVAFGSGVRMGMMGWSLRADLAWGVDDYTVQNPSLTLSMAKNF